MTPRGKKRAKSALNNPYSRRLEHVRKTIAGGITLKEFHSRLFWLLQDDGTRFDVSYSAARNYHYDREPPLSYINQVAKVFRLRPEWLLTEQGAVMKEEGASRAEPIQRLRIAVYNAFREELGPLIPIGVEGIDQIIHTAVPIIALLNKKRGDEHGLNEHTRYVEAASSLGRAVASPLHQLTLDPTEWTEAIKAQYVLQAIAAVLVPVHLEFVRAVTEAAEKKSAAPPTTAGHTRDKPTKRRKS